MAGAYQPVTCISCAMVPIMSPNSVARSAFQEHANDTPDGRPMEPTPVNVLFSEAGPSSDIDVMMVLDTTLG